mgnify:FL=1
MKISSMTANQQLLSYSNSESPDFPETLYDRSLLVGDHRFYFPMPAVGRKQAFNKDLN